MLNKIDDCEYENWFDTDREVSHKRVYSAKQRFYWSKEWRRLRQKVLSAYGTKCMKCGDDSGKHQVDHIRPRAWYPHKQLDFDNLQVLCKDCNFQKGGYGTTDYRNKHI